MTTELPIIDIALWITACFLFFGGVFGFIRLVKGPYLVDRIVALDFLSFAAVAIICLVTIYFTESKYLDVAIILALLGFLATVAFARHAEKRKQQGAQLEELDD